MTPNELETLRLSLFSTGWFIAVLFGPVLGWIGIGRMILRFNGAPGMTYQGLNQDHSVSANGSRSLSR